MRLPFMNTSGEKLATTIGRNKMTQIQLAEAIHVTTHWYRYRQSYVTLCNRVLMQRGLKLKGGENVS